MNSPFDPFKFLSSLHLRGDPFHFLRQNTDCRYRADARRRIAPTPIPRTSDRCLRRSSLTPTEQKESERLGVRQMFRKTVTKTIRRVIGFLQPSLPYEINYLPQSLQFSTSNSSSLPTFSQPPGLWGRLPAPGRSVSRNRDLTSVTSSPCTSIKRGKRDGSSRFTKVLSVGSSLPVYRGGPGG